MRGRLPYPACYHENAVSLDSERLIGLSLRKSGGWELTEWPADRQNLYLLRTDIEQPLSVDVAVWAEARAAHSAATSSGIQLALTVVDAPDCSVPHPEWEWPLEWPAGSHSFLGYDVADAGRISGLMNCGYTSDHAELRERFARHLNRHHLFSDRERALHFRRVTDTRVPEHAPFFVYGLYRLNPPI